MKDTLLGLTQNILSSMDGDEVSTINATVESQQVALCIKNTYFDIKNRADLPELRSLVNLTETSVATPIQMTVPTEVDQLEWIQYDKHTSTGVTFAMQPVLFMPLENFLAQANGYDNTLTNVGSFTVVNGIDSFLIQYRNDKAPSYYTTFDDMTLLFDSFDNTVDTFLRATKSLAYAKMQIPFTMTDNFIPDLDEPQFQLLFNEAKALAWAELKQTTNMKAETAAKRAWTSLACSKYATQHPTPFDKLPYYGRR